LRSVARFAISGGIVALLAFTITAILQIVGLPFQAAFAIAYTIGITVHFFLHRYFTFTADGQYRLRARHQASRFLAVALGNYLLIAVSVALLTSWLGLPSLLIYAVVAGIAAVANFVLLAVRVFHRERAAHGGYEERASDGHRGARPDQRLLNARDRVEAPIQRPR
jgi:putative flippase GtrA